MNDIIQIAVNNGLGIASFIALLFIGKYFVNTFSNTLKEISDTLLNIQTALITLSERVSQIEKRDDDK